jgi:predicted transcriptional regulator of viral defense system
MPKAQRSRLQTLARRRGLFTAADARGAGVHSQELTRLLGAGGIQRVARGQYRFAEKPITEHHALAVAARAVPRGVICLLSALSYHGIGTQLPADVWIAIDTRSRKPAVKQLAVEIVRSGGAAFTEGIQVHRIEGEAVRIYSVAKTLADLFKYRNKVGLDVALEALREAWKERKFTMPALDRAAKACRVERVMRPYVEAVVS